MRNKKRVLFVSESHNLASGFGTYAKEVVSRLHATGKYEIAEFASYGNHESIDDVPWDYYGNLPDPNDKQQTEHYNSSSLNHFGFWRFTHVLLDFKPDIVLTYRDPWMDMWIKDNPLRRFFHWVWMPTVDSSPQKREWLETFKTCDAILTYSEFGQKTLDIESNGSINTIGCASPAIDPSVYYPFPDKGLHKESLGLDPDSFIVGTVMRNQKRKLFIELMRSFRLFLDNAPKEISSKTYLYLHTSYPEKVGWDIQAGLLEEGIAANTLCTYICRSCNFWKPMKFRGAIATCQSCGNRTAFMPNVGSGLDIEDLVKVYNSFDLYVQYAICEGFGMPQVEAAGCGVPVAATNYSAMEDVVKNTKGFPIKIDKMYREMETNADRAYPSNEHLSKIMLNFFSKDDSYRKKKSSQARQGVLDRYNWDETASVWERYIDSYTAVGSQSKWDIPKRQLPIPSEVPKYSNEDVSRWLYSQVGANERAFSYDASLNTTNLNYGCMIYNGLEPFSRDTVLKKAQSIIKDANTVEEIRVGEREMSPVTFLKKGVVNG
jgi:glycosyltransferase involved in cell wall biosynthesis